MKRLTPFVWITLVASQSGCGQAVRYFSEWQQTGDESFGVTYYVGGAGPIGHVGSLHVPNGLAEAGYSGKVVIFPWQGMTHAGDQINITRNRAKGAELAHEIREHRRRYPDTRINIIALSAGTGIATFALEYLPEDVQVANAVYLGCSMSSAYDLTRALRRVSGGLYVVYSSSDPILDKFVWYTGPVDRGSAEDGIAGLEGFHLPPIPGLDTTLQYRKVHNVPYRSEFAEAGYYGRHTDSTRRHFIAQFVSGVILGKPERLLGARPEPSPAAPPATQPARRLAPTTRPAITADHGIDGLPTRSSPASQPTAVRRSGGLRPVTAPLRR